MADTISVLVVDDEAPARRRLTELLRADGETYAVREAENGLDAIAMIDEAAPDILFLDVQMPGVDGFGVVEAIGAENMPLTIFVTAYNEFAVQAFEADAVDYLLKPFGDRRFEATIARVKARLRDARSQSGNGAGNIGPELLKLVSKRSTPGEIWNWVAVKDRTGTQLIMADEIDCVEAAGVYVTIHARGAEFLYRAPLATFADRLDPFHFVRIHRSSIVNLRSVATLNSRTHGDFDVILRNGTRLVMSRTYRENFEQVLGQAL